MATLEEKKPLSSDWQDRQNAVQDLTNNYVVLAGAGTGKTSILIERLQHLILGKEIPVERIVALTFTKKAAEEMRERLEEKLRASLEDAGDLEALWEKYPEAKSRHSENVQKALNDIPKAQIGTIHSFAGYLLRLYPMQANVDPAFREDEGEKFEGLFEKEWSLWLAKELGENAPRAAMWKTILSEVPVDDLREIAEKAAARFLPFSETKKARDTKPLVKQCLKDIEKCRQQFPSPDRAKVFADSLDQLTRFLESCFSGEPISPEIRSAIPDLSIDKPPKAWEAAKFQLRDLKRKAKALALVNEPIIQGTLDLLQPFIERFQRESTRKGIMTFDGLLYFARNLLRDHEQAREDVKKKFDVFLVDEFQDTDPLQGEMLFYLAEVMGGKAKDWSQVKLEKGRLFVVGDPKQSIYRFRGADMAAFQSFRQALVNQGAKEVLLLTNFRSQDSLLNGVNALFPPLMKEEDFVQAAYSPLFPYRTEKAQGRFEMAVLEKQREGKESSSNLRRREAEWIADWIEKEVGKEESSIQYQDCALLFRSANAFEEYLEVFKARGIPYLAEGEKFFYQTVEVTDFLNLLSVLADPRDTLSLVGVLRSPLGALSDKDILALKKAGGLRYDRPPKVLKDKVEPLYKKLRSFSQKSERVSVGELIHDLFRETWVLALTSQSKYGEQGLANLLKIRTLAEDWAADQPLSLRSFVRRFKMYREDQKEEGENPLADVKYNAVKLMTIHKAKGLEFPVVFLPNLCASKGGRNNKTVLIQDWRSGAVGVRLPSSGWTNNAMVLLEEEVVRREQAEEVRVFYVAATRARERMVFMLRENPPASSEYVELLKEANAWPQKEKGPLPELTDPIQVHHLTWKEEASPLLRAPLEKLSPDWSPEVLSTVYLRRQKEKEVEALRTLFQSPTRIMGKKGQLLIDEPEKKPLNEEEEYIPSRDKAIKIGLLCHKVLEGWNFAIPKNNEKAQLERQIQRVSPIFGLVEKETWSNAIQKESFQILSGFFGSAVYSRLSQANIIGRETPFLFPHKEGAIMRGVIDLLYEWKGQWVIADYKTNKMDKSTETKMKEKYLPQAQVYKEAIWKSCQKKAQFELIFLREGKTVSIL